MDLVVGGSILAAAIILIASVLWLKELSVTAKRVKYTCVFPNIGTLQLGDPVMVNGVKKGRVLTIDLYKDSVAAVVELDKSILLTDSGKITVQNIGLMGERMVGIQLSHKGTPYAPSSKAHMTYISGYFDSGIGEAMGMVGTVLAQVQVLVKNVEGIVQSTIGDTAFLVVFQNVVDRLDTLTLVAGNLVQKDGPKIDRAVSDLQSTASQMQQLIAANKADLETLIKNGSQLSENALAITNQLDTITVSVSGMLNDIQNGKGSLGMIMKDEGLYKNIKNSMQEIDTLLRDVQDDGLKLRIKVGFRKSKR
jgi:phospholipid/cholesterol/gamma-HCH transport system substrate-binding protein